MSWYDDEDDNQLTNDSFGFAPSQSDNSAQDNEQSNNEEDSTKKGITNKLGKKRVVLLTLILVATILIVVVSLVFGGSSTKPEKEQQEVSNITTVPTATPKSTNSTSDWLDMTGATFESGVEHTSRFVMTNHKLYVRKTGGTIAPLEIRLELWGAIDGYDGIYKIDVPYGTLEAANVWKNENGAPLSFKISFKVGTYNGSKIIYDIRAN